MSLFTRRTSTTTQTAQTAQTAPSAVTAPGAPAQLATLDREPAPSAVADISGDYTLDPAHTRIGFSARHAMVTTVRGEFSDFDGVAHIDLADVSRSHVEVRIRTASVSTGQAQRDEHLRTGDFFDVEGHPEIVFTSTTVERVEDDVFAITGDLRIKDVTRPVTVEFTLAGSARDPYGNRRVGFEGTATINRKDWGLTYNAALETGGVLISDRIKLELDVSAIAVAAA